MPFLWRSRVLERLAGKMLSWDAEHKSVRRTIQAFHSVLSCPSLHPKLTDQLMWRNSGSRRNGQTAWPEMHCNVCTSTHTHTNAHTHTPTPHPPTPAQVSEVKGERASDLKNNHTGKALLHVVPGGKTDPNPLVQCNFGKHQPKQLIEPPFTSCQESGPEAADDISPLLIPSHLAMELMSHPFEPSLINPGITSCVWVPTLTADWCLSIQSEHCSHTPCPFLQWNLPSVSFDGSYKQEGGIWSSDGTFTSISRKKMLLMLLNQCLRPSEVRKMNAKFLLKLW